jgi:hypothetical protein
MTKEIRGLDKVVAKADAKRFAENRKYREDEDKDFEALIALSKSMREKKENKKEAEVDLPKYTRSPYANYKLLKGKVMDAHSDLHADKNGKRIITTKMKIWQHLTPRDKADLKRSIMLALNHKFKGGSISDFPKEVRGVVNEVFKHMTGGGFLDDLNRVSGKLMPQHTRNLNKAIDKTKQVVSNVKNTVQEVRDATDKMRAAKGMGFTENYFKPKGHRQLIYFSDSSSDEDEPHLPVKRGRGRPRCS